jgi:hypothetical protein
MTFLAPAPVVNPGKILVNDTSCKIEGTRMAFAFMRRTYAEYSAHERWTWLSMALPTERSSTLIIIVPAVGTNAAN